MATTVPTVPIPPDPSVVRFDEHGRPTVAQIEYEQRVLAFMRAVAAKVAS